MSDRIERAMVNGNYCERHTSTFMGRTFYSYFMLRRVKTPGITGANEDKMCSIPDNWKKVIAEIDRQCGGV